MDPNATLDRILQAIFHDVDYDEAFDAMTDLQDWLSKGGFNPQFNQSQCELMIDCMAQMIAELQ